MGFFLRCGVLRFQNSTQITNMVDLLGERSIIQLYICTNQGEFHGSCR